MDISITGVTSQRQFLKTCVRLRWFMDELRECSDDVDTSGQRFDILQLVFLDRPESFLKVESTKDGDRLLQVYVGIGLERDFSQEQDHAFLCLVAEQTLRAVHHSPLSLQLRGEVAARVERWRDSLGERFDETPRSKA